MEKVTFGNIVGFVLAAAFALVIGMSMWGLLVGDYMNRVSNEQTQHTMRIVGFAGALAALAAFCVSSTSTPLIRTSRTGRCRGCTSPR